MTNILFSKIKKLLRRRKRLQSKRPLGNAGQPGDKLRYRASKISRRGLDHTMR